MEIVHLFVGQHTESQRAGCRLQCHLLCELALWGRGFCPAAGLPAGAFCDEFAVIQRQKCQLRSERKLGRKAEALPHRPFRHKVSGVGLPTRMSSGDRGSLFSPTGQSSPGRQVFIPNRSRRASVTSGWRAARLRAATKFRTPASAGHVTGIAARAT